MPTSNSTNQNCSQTYKKCVRPSLHQVAEELQPCPPSQTQTSERRGQLENQEELKDHSYDVETGSPLMVQGFQHANYIYRFPQVQTNLVRMAGGSPLSRGSEDEDEDDDRSSKNAVSNPIHKLATLLAQTTKRVYIIDDFIYNIKAAQMLLETCDL